MQACTTCQWSGLPRRNVCPRCEGKTWKDVSQVTGVVRAVTHVHRAFGAQLVPPQVLALVELDDGGWVIGTGDVLVGSGATVDASRVVRPR